jgi:hypothetical protein
VVVLPAYCCPSAQSSRRMTFPPHHLRTATPPNHVTIPPLQVSQAPPCGVNAASWHASAAISIFSSFQLSSTSSSFLFILPGFSGLWPSHPGRNCTGPIDPEGSDQLILLHCTAHWDGFTVASGTGVPNFYLVPIGTPTFFFIGCAVLYCALEKNVFPSLSLSAALKAIEGTSHCRRCVKIRRFMVRLCCYTRVMSLLFERGVQSSLTSLFHQPCVVFDGVLENDGFAAWEPDINERDLSGCAAFPDLMAHHAIVLSHAGDPCST